MFDKFGEFDSAEEINRAAAAQLKEGDLDAIKTIAEENGLDPEDAEDFCTGVIDSLTTPLLAAIGKLEMESKDLGLKNMMEDWKNFLIQMCEEGDQMAQAVRKKGKSLEKCMAQILKVSFETKAQLDDRIVQAAGLKPPIYLGIPGSRRMEIKLQSPAIRSIPGKRLCRKDGISGQRTIPESTERNCCMHGISGMEHGVLRTIRHKSKEHKQNVLHQRPTEN